MAGEPRSSLSRAELVRPEGQLPAGRDLRVFLPQRSGRRVARIGEEAPARLGLAAVELLEGGQGHVQLAPDLEHGRAAAAVEVETLGDHPHRGHVGGDVLTGLAVASRRRPTVPAVLVEDRDRQTVDLQLAGEGHLAADDALHALAPRHQLLEGEGVVEAHHGQPVAHRREERRRRCPHRLCRRGGRSELGMGVLQVP